MYISIIVSVGLYGCEAWHLTFREEQAEGVRKQGDEEDIWV
jgi:hypothetical protein